MQLSCFSIHGYGCFLQANDPQSPKARNAPDVRQVAEEALQHMVAPELMRAAVTADYASECMRFLRNGFDVQDPDPAAVVELLNAFSIRMKSLFVEGFILSRSQAEGSDANKTACEMVFDEVDTAEPPLGYYYSLSKRLPFHGGMCSGVQGNNRVAWRWELSICLPGFTTGTGRTFFAQRLQLQKCER